MAGIGIVTDFQLPIQAVRDFVRDQMAAAWSLTGAQVTARSKYPSRGITDEMLDSRDANAATGVDSPVGPDGLIEQYIIATPGLSERLKRYGNVGWDYTFPLYILVARKVDDTPQDDSLAMLARAGQLLDKLLVTNSPRWSGVTGMKYALLEHLMTEFDGIEELWALGWTAVIMEMSLMIQVEGF